MSYQAKVVNVMIASPSDVERERSLARKVILTWNAINSADRKIILQPIGWETHSTPSMSGTAQQVINSQVLEKADLLVAIFWTRLGSPTGEYASGTVEEIEEHIKAGKPAMIYFSTTPVQPDSIDQEQYALLVDFRDKLKNRGLVSFYSESSEFSEQFLTHLSKTIIETFGNSESLPAIIDVDSLIRQPQLDENATELLIAAVKDPHGMITYSKYLGGSEMWAGETNFIRDRSPRSVARWEHALKQLESLNFIVDQGYKGEVFSVTEAGYSYAESIGVTLDEQTGI